MLLNGKRLEHLHFVGVSGIGVSAAAKITLEAGTSVSGSADLENEQTDMLSSRGMRFFLGHRAENVNSADGLVVSAAVPDNNPEILEAKRKGIPLYLYSEFIGILMGQKRGIAVAGTHGKTTTTALVATILSRAGLDPTVVCGGVMRGFDTNALFGRGEHFVSEACEYNRSFLDLRKRYAVVTNIESDHLDYYGSLDEIKGAFRRFLQTIDPEGFSVVNGDDEGVRDVMMGLERGAVFTVGEGEANQYRVEDVSGEFGVYSCSVKSGTQTLLSLRLSVPGRFNCGNAALASVLALRLGVAKETVEGAVLAYAGTKRRLEHLGRVGESEVYTDYGHHPTEIRSTLRALKERHPGQELCLVFQPHQYSRTLELFDEFVSSLSEPDLIILTEIYWQRDSEKYIGKVTGEDLYAAVAKRARSARFVPEKGQIPRLLEGLGGRCGVVLFMGAGDIDDVAREYASGKEGRGL
jgi:UDP-N-acetylmuramate--alanine ligase